MKLKAIGKNGITPILAIILTLMMAVAIASGLFYWLSRMQNQQQGTAGQSQERLFETLATCINAPTFDFNTLDNQSNLIVQNCGNTKLEFGDSRIVDSAIISATGVDPCNFNINTSLCVGCPVTLDPGSVATLTLNWTAEPNCASKIVRGVKHQISFFVDRKATTSRSFVPDDILKCNGGLGLTNTTQLEISTGSGTASACFNLTIQNLENTIDTATISNTTNSTSVCGNPVIRDGGCFAGTFNRTVTVRSKSITQIYVNSSAPIAIGSCGITISLTSANGCNAKQATLSLTHTRTA